ncbi:glycosyltransferase [Rhodococcus sp. 14-2470-1a]|uniref:glycosyltransferase n=1 Tax=Rhodococcus sp. 14-2470-1a TaxID=2023150 RepID=UPI000B9A8BAE|nr:hypothetical protein CH292_05960 [Rhodococcus sp. 14-2470-1a]
MSDIFGIRNGSRAILCASTGGHLQQLHKLSQQMGIAPKPLWITFSNAQSNSLLAGERVEYIPYIASRDFATALRSSPHIARIMARERFDVAVSTGAAIAGVALPVAKALRKDSVYIESVARFDGPSLTGKSLRFIPGIRRFTQHPSWANEDWTYETSVLNSYAAKLSPTADGIVKQVFVTLGTIKPYRFDSLVERVKNIVPSGTRIVWQLGATDRSDLPGVVHTSMPIEHFDRLVMESDVIITHAGVGSAIRILDSGKCPVMVPRRRSRGEHIDDHQVQISSRLSGLGLVVEADACAITFSDLQTAAATRVSQDRK